nr:MAG TPA: hypothetical protein [Caudoviricetes sp.]
MKLFSLDKRIVEKLLQKKSFGVTRGMVRNELTA